MRRSLTPLLFLGLANHTLAFAGLANQFSVVKTLFSSLRNGGRKASAVGDLQCSAGSSKPRLMYFDARGVVEPARLLFAAAGVDYDDHRYKGS
jgi:hypothetical protein